MFKGIGDPWIRTTGLDDRTTPKQRLLPLGLLSFELASDTESKRSQAFNSSGELVTQSTVRGSTQYTLTLSYNEITWGALGFALDQFPRSATNVSLPLLKYATVPTTSPYTITDAGITTGNAGLVSVTITRGGSWGQSGQWLNVINTGTPTAGQVKVEAGTLTFAAAQAGATVAYPVYTNYSAIQDLGGPSGGTAWGEFEFWGRIVIPTISAGVLIQIPQVTIAEDPTITIDDSVPTVSVVCGMGVPVGWDRPYRLLNLDTGTVA